MCKRKESEVTLIQKIIWGIFELNVFPSQLLITSLKVLRFFDNSILGKYKFLQNSFL